MNNAFSRKSSVPGRSHSSPRIRAILQAFFVTVLWASSWVLIKFGLRNDMPPLTFAGLRYGMAWVCLLPFVLFKRESRSEFRQLSWKDWQRLIVLGLVFYTLTQGSQFLSLAYLPAAMVSLLLNLTPVAVGLSAAMFLSEHPTRQQWCWDHIGDGWSGNLLPAVSATEDSGCRYHHCYCGRSDQRRPHLCLGERSIGRVSSAR